jgi:hypothetical protein
MTQFLQSYYFLVKNILITNQLKLDLLNILFICRFVTNHQLVQYLR